jgi:hypothetical protein
MKTITIATTAWMLIPAFAPALTPFSDGFNTNTLNPVRWQVSQFHNAKLRVGQQRVNFFIYPAFHPDEDYGYLELLNNQPGINENWQVTLTINNTSGQGDRIGAGFWIHNADDPSDVIFYEFYGNAGKRARKCAAACFVLNGTTMAQKINHHAAKLTAAKLRIVYAANTKLFTFRIAPAVPAARWRTLGTFSPTGIGGDVRANWNLNPGSGRFGIRLEAYGEQRLLDGGKVFMDNFVLSAP